MVLYFLDLCLMSIKSLGCIGLINYHDGNNEITSKPEGEIMAKYSISFTTMTLYMQVCLYFYNIPTYYNYRQSTFKTILYRLSKV